MYKCFYRLLALLLGGIFGFSGCGSQTAEYGMPNASYQVNGTVVTASNHAPVPGIRIKFDSSVSGPTGDVVLTDVSGNWSLLLENSFYCAEQCALQVDDVDGAANLGEFSSKKVPLTLQQTGSGDGHWNHGTFVQQGIEIELEPKQ